MVSRKLTLTVVLVACLCLSSWAAKFKTFSRAPEEAELNVPHAPDLVVPFRTFSIVVDNATGTFPYARQLNLSIEKELTGAFSVVTSGAEGSLKISVLEFSPPSARNYEVMEQRTVVPTGNQNLILALIPQKVPITYWEARGLLTLKAVLKDKAGSTIDETVIKAPFSLKREIAVNHITKVDHNSLPGQDDIMANLLLAGARSVRRRYAVGLEPIKVNLTIDNELLPGNQLAIEGDWEGALNAWEAAKMKTNSGDRDYNLALANYALGFKNYADSQGADSSSSRLAEGARLLESAERTDPKEPYFKQVESRLAAAKQEMEKGLQQAKALAVERERQSDAASAALEAASGAGSKNLDSGQPESPQEAEFRKYVRAQWKGRTHQLTDADLVPLQNTGRVAWKLTPAQAQRVVSGEAEIWKGRQEKEALYLANLQGFLNDGMLSAEGRGELRKLSANLGLTDAEVAAIESKVSFREESRPRHAPSSRPAAPGKPESRKAARPGNNL